MLPNPFELLANAGPAVEVVTKPAGIDRHFIDCSILGICPAFVIGLVFALCGIILTGCGLATNGDPMHAKSLDLNVNTIWGCIMLVFGLVMPHFAKRGKKA